MKRCFVLRHNKIVANVSPDVNHFHLVKQLIIVTLLALFLYDFCNLTVLKDDDKMKHSFIR